MSGVIIAPLETRMDVFDVSIDIDDYLGANRMKMSVAIIKIVLTFIGSINFM